MLRDAVGDVSGRPGLSWVEPSKYPASLDI